MIVGREAEGGRMVAGLGIGGNDVESMFVVVRLFCIGLSGGGNEFAGSDTTARTRALSAHRSEEDIFLCERYCDQSQS